MVAAGGVLGMAAEEAADKGRIEEREVRVFRVSVDVRSFRAGSRLPARAVNAFVRVVLPQSIVKLAMTSPYPANAAKLTAPLRTHPPVLVAKGTEIIIPNGYVALELPASIASLSTALAEEPHILAQVLHSDRYMADSVIGIASVPMAPLLNESRLDGYAPVFSPWDGGKGGVEEQVNIGALRIVLVVEELGPVMGAPKRHHRQMDHASLHPSNQQGEHLLPHHIDPISLLEKPKGGSNKERTGVDDVLESARHGRHGSREWFDGRGPLRSAETIQGSGGDHGGVAPPSKKDLRQTLEYEMAWEFEMWRQSEEVKWRAELKEREMSRMLALEDEWRRQEKDLSMEAEKTRKEQDALEAKLKTKLFELEKMERKLVQGQEAASHRKEALEREYTQRLTDAQVAVTRHQTECEHRVELEQGKYTALLEQHALLEKRFATTNKSHATLEKQFSDYKVAQRNTIEADLAAQVLVLKQQCSDYKASLDAAVRSKEEYKAQVLRMAKEMAGFYRGHQDTNKGNGQFGANVISKVKPDDDKHESLDLKEQVHYLRLHGQMATSCATHATPQSLPLSSAANFCNMEASVRPPLSKTANVGIGGTSDCVPPRSNVQTQTNQQQEDEGLMVRDPSAKTTTKPIFAQPVRETNRLGTVEEQTIDQPNNTRLGNVEPKSYEVRRPLLEVGQKMKDDSSAHATFHQKGRPQQLSDVENELIEGGPDDTFKEKEIRRLKRQRSELLETGIYGISDRIIRGLDMEVRRLETGG